MLTPKSPAPTAFFSSRYRQTTVHHLFNSFNCCKCLVLSFGFQDFLGGTKPGTTPTATPNYASPLSTVTSWRIGRNYAATLDEPARLETATGACFSFDHSATSSGSKRTDSEIRNNGMLPLAIL
jgi:hypothetical protein